MRTRSTSRIPILLMMMVLPLALLVGCQSEPARKTAGGAPPADSRKLAPGSAEERDNTTLFTVAVVDAQTAFAFGTNDQDFTGSVIIRTSDGGATWKCVLRTGMTEIVALDFVDAQNGAALSDGGVLYTTADGGQTWEGDNDSNLFKQVYTLPSAAPEPGVMPRNGAQGPNLPEFIELYGISFRGEKDGWAFGSREETTQGSKPGTFATRTRPVVLRTSDGGETWSLVSLPASLPAFGLSRSAFVDQTTGWVVAGNIDEDDSGAILKTTDGGATWAVLPAGPAKQVPEDVYFLDATTGWAVGATEDASGEPGPSHILATKDGGATWQIQTKVAASLRSICFADTQNGWAVGSNGRTYRTTDGGTTWAEQTVHDWSTGQVLDTTDPIGTSGQPQPTYNAFVLVAPGHGFAASDLGIHEYRAR